MATTAASASRSPFPNYMLMRRRVPLWVWHAGRVLSVAAAFVECALLVVDKKLGLNLWWKVAIPLLPAVWLSAPGLWRNLCPLAAFNQTPRLFKFTRGLELPDWYREYAPVVGMVAFIVLVASREPLFNGSGIATAVLIGASLVGAFAGGLVFKGKSGWCSSICPLLPVQRVYGQTPYVMVPNSHCQTCVGCTKNCYDFNPRVAWLADMADPDRHYTGYWRFFVGAFPGLILCYFTLPQHISTGGNYGRFAVYIGVSAASFFLAETLLKVSAHRITTVYAAAAISLYYWYAPRVLSRTITGEADAAWLVWGLRGIVWALAAAWVLRTWHKEDVFIAAGEAGVGTSRVTSGGLAAARAARAADPEVTIAPSGCGWWRSRRRRCWRCSSGPGRRSRPAAGWESAARTRCASSPGWRTFRRSPARSAARSSGSGTPRTRAWRAARGSTARLRCRRGRSARPRPPASRSRGSSSTRRSSGW